MAGCPHQVANSRSPKFQLRVNQDTAIPKGLLGERCRRWRARLTNATAPPLRKTGRAHSWDVEWLVYPPGYQMPSLRDSLWIDGMAEGHADTVA
jgi:hypothetical protein